VTLIIRIYVAKYRRERFYMDDSAPAPVIISREAFLTLKHLKDEFEDVIETIEILNTPKLMEQIDRSRKDVSAGRVCNLSSSDDLDSIWE
jgi:hypothetical protein